jgi:hypothetical protein
MVDAFVLITRSPIAHTHPRRENIWDTAVLQTETPTTAVVTAVTIARVVTTVLTTAKVAVTETVVVVSPAAMTRIVTVILMAVIVVTAAIVIGVGAHLLVATHPTIVDAGAIPGPLLREAVAPLGRQGTMMAPPTAPAGKYALCHYLST